MGKTIKEKILKLPKDRQDKIKARTKELINLINNKSIILPSSNYQEPLIKEYNSI